jgi:predicted small lipoprotein YifL
MKNQTLALMVLAVTSITLVGCGEKTPPKEVKTVSYYTANPAERDRVVAACKENPGQSKDDLDCINANDSVIQGWGKAKLPGVSFGAQKSSTAASN